MAGYFKKKVNNLKDGTKSVVGVDQIKKNWEWIKQDSKALFDGIKGVPRSEHLDDGDKSFSELREKYNVSDEKLKRIYRDQRILAYISLFLFVFVLCVLAYYLIKGEVLSSILSGLVSIIALSKFMEYSLASASLRAERQLTIKEWFSMRLIFPPRDFERL